MVGETLNRSPGDIRPCLITHVNIRLSAVSCKLIDFLEVLTEITGA